MSGLRDRIAICLMVAVSHVGTREWRKQFHQTITNGLRYRAPVIVDTEESDRRESEPMRPRFDLFDRDELDPASWDGDRPAGGSNG